MKSRTILSLVFSLLLTGSLSADSDFTGAVDNLWSNPLNWTDVIPGAGEKATFKGVFCVLDYEAPTIENVNVRMNEAHLQLVDGAVLTVTSWSAIGWKEGSPDSRDLMEIVGGCLIAMTMLGSDVKDTAIW